MPPPVVARRRAERAALLDGARRFTETLRSRLSILAAVVFGSVARGDFNAWSDVDLLIIAAALPEDPLSRYGLLGALPPRIEVVLWTPQEWHRRSGSDPLRWRPSHPACGCWGARPGCTPPAAVIASRVWRTTSGRPPAHPDALPPGPLVRRGPARRHQDRHPGHDQQQDQGTARSGSMPCRASRSCPTPENAAIPSMAAPATDASTTIATISPHRNRGRWAGPGAAGPGSAGGGAGCVAGSGTAPRSPAPARRRPPRAPAPVRVRAPALFVLGTPIAPLNALGSLVMQHTLPPDRRAEGFALMTAAILVGAGLGQALCGLLLDAVAPGALLAASAVVPAGLALALSAAAVRRGARGLPQAVAAD